MKKRYLNLIILSVLLMLVSCARMGNPDGGWYDDTPPKDYKYAHDFENNFVEDNFFPEQLKQKKFWEPQNNAAENKIVEWMKRLWKNRF